MKVIHRYQIKDTGSTKLVLPPGFRVVHCAYLGDWLSLWVELDPEARGYPVEFRAIRTGEEYDPAGLVQVGTAVLGAWPNHYVVHVFRVES